MAKNVNHILHLRGNQKVDGKPYLPSASTIIEGEIAINFADGVETLLIKNDNDEIATFSSDDYYTEKKLGTAFTSGNSAVTVTEYLEDIEEVISAAFNDLDGRKMDESAYTPTDLSDYYTKSQTSGASEISAALDNYYTKSQTSGASEIADALENFYDKPFIDEKLGSAFTGNNSAVTITEYIDEIEEVAATAVNDLNSNLNYLKINKLDVSAYTPTDLSGYYTKVETDNKLGSAFTDANSAVTITDYLDEIDIVISEALVDLYERKLDASAYTPTDLSDYYTKSQTSGASEIADALQEKQDISGMSAYTTSVEFETKIGSAFTDTNSAVTITEYLEDIEEVISAAFNDLDERKMDASAYTPTDLSNYYTKSQTSGASEISAALDNYYTKSQTSGASEIADALEDYYDKLFIDEKLGSGFTGENSGNTVTSVIEENEEVVASALADLDKRKLDESYLINYYTISQVDDLVETINYNLDDLNASVSGLSEESETVAAALVYLKANKMDLSAYTPTDLSDYYTKANIDDKLGSGFTGENSGVSVTQAIVDNEMAVESALTALHDDIEELSSANYAYLSPDSGAGIVPGDGIRAEVVESSSAISVNPDVVTIISGSVGEATITLEVPEDILAHVWDIMLETSSAPNITIAMSNSATIHYPLGYATNPSVNIELSIIGVGDKYYLRYGEFV